MSKDLGVQVPFRPPVYMDYLNKSESLQLKTELEELLKFNSSDKIYFGVNINIEKALPRIGVTIEVRDICSEWLNDISEIAQQLAFKLCTKVTWEKVDKLIVDLNKFIPGAAKLSKTKNGANKIIFSNYNYIHSYYILKRIKK